MTIRCTPFLLLTALACTAQDDVFDHVRAEALRHGRGEGALLHLSDRLGGRLTGSDAHRAAADWVAEQLAAYGLDVAVEELELPATWRPGAASVRVVEPVERPLPALAGGFAPPTDEPVRARVVTARADVEGAIVLVGADDPRPDVPAERPPFPEARACLIDAQRPYALLATGTATWAPPFTAGALPAAFVAAEDAAWIRRRLAAGESVVVELTVGGAIGPAGTAPEVIADLKGRAAADQIVLAVAWLDSWHVGDGAVDDAAGVAVLLEAARILAGLEERPLRTIRFALLAGGAQGAGTDGYARRRDANALLRHVAGFATLGGGAALTGLMLEQQFDVLPLAESWFAPVQDLGVVDIGYRAPLDDRLGALHAAGVPIFAFVQEAPLLDIVRGTRADTFDKVVPSDLQQAACVLATGLWAAANGETLPERFRAR